MGCGFSSSKKTILNQSASTIDRRCNLPATVSYSRDLKPLTTRYCASCHMISEPKGGFTIPAYASDVDAIADKARWEKIFYKVSNKIMPPGPTKLNDCEVALIQKFIDPDAFKSNDQTPTPIPEPTELPEIPQVACQLPAVVSYESTIKPIFSQYCYKCHGSSEANKDINFEQYATEASALAARSTFEKGLSQITKRIMPPRGEARPTSCDVAKIQAWLNPAPNSLPGLKGEYFNDKNLQTLVGSRVDSKIDMCNAFLGQCAQVWEKPNSNFPGVTADYSYSERWTGEIYVNNPGTWTFYTQSDDGVRLSINNQLIINNWTDHANTENSATLSLQAGWYPITLEHYQGAAGDVIIRLSFMGPGTAKMIVPTANLRTAGVAPQPSQSPQPNPTCQIPATVGHTTLQRLSKTEYDNTIKSILGLSSSPSQLIPADSTSPIGFDNNADSLVMSPDHMAAFMESNKNAVEAALAVANTPFLNCGGGAQDAACIQRLMTTFAAKAYRRPATTVELKAVTDLAGLVRTSGGTFAQAVGAAMQALLLSPSFLYKGYGLSPTPTDGSFISHYEMATRLAYFLWNSPPDQVLLDLAANGTLNTPSVLVAQVRRMLLDPKMDLFAENFSGQWLNTRQVLSSMEVSRNFAAFTPSLRMSMKNETDLFFSNLIKTGASPYDLLTGNYTYLNEELARHYGIAGVTGTQFRRVSLAGTKRIGVTTHAGVLTLNASATETSPTKRGYWLLKKLTCNQPNQPPGNVDTTLPVTGASLTLKETMAEHTKKGSSCYGCHSRMDPVGFAYENFGAIGQYRTTDSNGNPLDPTGEWVDGRRFADHFGMLDILSADEEFPSCVAQKVMTYAVGRTMKPEDECAIKEIANKAVTKTSKFSDLLEAIVLSDLFRKYQ